MYGDRAINSVLPEDLEEYQETRADAGMSPRTIDMELSIVKTMINRAADNRKVGPNALLTFRAVRPLMKAGANARDRIVSIEEYKKLLSVAAEHLRPVLITVMNTGMRKGEVLGLLWEHVDRKAGVIRLPAELTKEGRVKTIPMNRNVSEALDGLLRHTHHDTVFTYNGKPIAEGLRKSFLSACKDAGIPYGMKVENGLRLHDFRTTVKTNMLRAGGESNLSRDTLRNPGLP